MITGTAGIDMLRLASTRYDLNWQAIQPGPGDQNIFFISIFKSAGIPGIPFQRAGGKRKKKK